MAGVVEVDRDRVTPQDLRSTPLLPAGALLLHRLPALLQAGHAAVLRGEAPHGHRHRGAAGLREVQGRRLQVREDGVACTPGHAYHRRLKTSDRNTIDVRISDAFTFRDQRSKHCQVHRLRIPLIDKEIT